MSAHERGLTRRHRLGRAGAGAWTFVLTVVTTIGLLAATTLWGWGTCLAVVLSSGLCAGCLATVTGPARPGRLVRISALWGALVAGTAGLVQLTGPLSLLVLLPLAATAPALWSRVRVWRILAGGPPVEQEATPGPASEVPGVPSDLEQRVPALVAILGALDDAELCLAWRRSFVLLNEATSPREKLVVVTLRERYLEELQRRSPAGVSRWLDSGARASGNPLPFLEDRRRS
ncbi:hypothetical protein KRR39_02625 [Nocardioides panacis]|uniref:Uncharacterized protein n=1 Tax=Nocardioides panacis TaxID=2849501 RepID=A0A975T0R2_9ACTN|nr:hypothetical protein [Nocardioides panacis]QWZ08769.1 hypothetical protein KRR39_02625 [Nocardioides panacis]